MARALTSQAHAVLDDLEILWPSKLGSQGTAPLLDDFCEVQVRLAIPVVLLSASA